VARPLLCVSLLAALSCACAQTTPREVQWVTTGGAPVSRDVVRAAARECESHIAVRTRTGPFKGSVEWGLAMLDCLREAGYVQAYADPHETEAPPAP
jgi:hypothetical protein